MENALIIISFALILLGILGIFIPVLPGPIFVLLGIVVYGFVTDFTVISLYWIVLFSILTFVTIVIDYLASFLTAKRFNVSSWGMIGMFIGGFSGLVIFNVIGLIIGQVVGLTMGELLSGRAWKESMKAGGAGVFAYFVSLIVKLFVTSIIVGIFIYLIR
ncbi:DUF456 domain-containing protein [Clostridium formicaceticum]|uniref:DUF456 domain-containing protein n=1 Tax=Clostridium formicaceticum TaxID=1497 RepID=A0AAC9RK07_9CLOT|nr:DUF456 domain-containing protein [Clostridium formicaceticum]AOY76329.1 hypothetical protein BJL90_10690 [Clostridium formicaceticum]ARE86718.1 hypothetical protein CLFO_10450 [Clostridium formicaceticum]